MELQSKHQSSLEGEENDDDDISDCKVLCVVLFNSNCEDKNLTYFNRVDLYSKSC
jgi:hypothetical protein